MTKVKEIQPGVYTFRCPGCKDVHQIYTGSTLLWSFNGDINKPTFNPSVLVRGGHYAPQFTEGCWCDYNRENPDEPSSFTCYCCHFYIKEGNIEFLSDCSHALAGKTMELQDAYV